MTQAIIEQTGDATVTLTFEALDSFDMAMKRYTREFWVPRCGEYIREGDRQVYRALSNRGNTLSATPETLLATIRREWDHYQKRVFMEATR